MTALAVPGAESTGYPRIETLRPTVGGTETVMTRWIPGSGPIRGAVVACHGGVNGLDGVVADASARLASSGFVVVAPHYRGEDGITSVRDVGASDVEDALVARELCGDAPLVAVWGNSRGGLVALLALAASPERFACAAATAPIDSLAFLHDVMDSRADPVAAEIRRCLGGTPNEVPEAYRRRDAATVAAHADRRPVFLGHAADDTVVPVARTLGLIHQWCGQSSLTVVMPTHGGHRVADDPAGPVWLGLVAFLNRYLADSDLIGTAEP